ncbi:MAG TPA: metalloregulator ArsR/SmtB family transcription factor [Aestuariivirgaceae bacterium]|nr:metalloregulator ArsR/SmtB family transcription factor [Aestuariivirgaceae bacterium]
MDNLLKGLRAIGEVSRLRLLHLLSHGELNVTEITQILNQSQPRISRHLKLMCDAGLLDRYREGSWVLFRMRDTGPGAALAQAILRLLPGEADQFGRDLKELGSVRDARAREAQQYFRANAADWHRIRALHVSEAEVESAMLALAGTGAIDTLVDLGTGTGRLLELFAPRARQAVGIDMSRDMLAVARANLDRAGLRHAQVRQGDVAQLPLADATADLVTIHQVLHYLDEPARALGEAARILKPGGRLVVVDFAPHELEFLRDEHAHRRLGIAADHMSGWLERARLDLERSETLKPPKALAKAGLSVSLWLAAKPPGDAAHSRKRTKDA